MTTTRISLLALGLAVAGCAADRATGPATASGPGAAEPAPHRPVITRYAAGPNGILVNAYLVETRDGVVAIDATLTVSDSRALRAKLEQIGKPLQAILLTHGHPDHYNGVTVLKAGDDVPVIATRAVADVIERDDAAKAAQWRPMFGDEWPARRTFPDRHLADGESVHFGGVTFTVRDLGPGESHADSYWIAEADRKYAFIGDVVMHDTHAYVSDGHTAAWLANLDRLERELAGVAVVYPGHGQPGSVAMLAWQRRYLQAYREAVTRLADRAATLSDDAKAELLREMSELVPSGALGMLVGMGADAVAGELAKR